MKNIKLAIIALSMIILYASAGLCGDIAKIGIVDLQKILELSEAGKDAQEKLKKEKEKMEEDLSSRGAEIKNLQEKLERESLVISKEAKDEKERDLRIKIYDFKTLEKKYREDLQEIQGRILKKIRNELLEVIEDIGKKDGYLLIMESIGVLYAPNSIDITDKVIQQYNLNSSKNKNK
ncbi:MAG: OmpH family outer membrane protein [Desulfobacterales bacterium]|nr:OmpH family outer membrane protein [Desulfobacterales bacterium]